MTVTCASAQGAEIAARPAELTVGSAFNDGMVLQQGCNVPVWGWAEPGEKVSVSFADQKVDAVAGTDGKWRADLRPMTACAVGRTLVVAAKTSQTFSDVLVGEVWWCSGQSNMAVTMWGGPQSENRHR